MLYVHYLMCVACLTGLFASSFQISSVQQRNFFRRESSVHFSLPLNSIYDEDEYDVSRIRDGIANRAIIEKLITGTTSKDKSSLVQLQLVGRGQLGPEDASSECLFLAEANGSDSSSLLYTTYESLPIPLPMSNSDNIIKLLSFAYKGKPISKSLCLTLSPLLINRDGALFDNLPFAKWSIDPLMKNRDAAQNSIEEKYHMGKRDAYNRFMGKDWYGRSLSIGNVAARAKYMLEKDEASETEDDVSYPVTLAQRVLELEVKESRMAVAEAEQQYAIINARFGAYDLDEISDEDLIEGYEAIKEGENIVHDAKVLLLETEEALELMLAPNESFKSNSFVSKILSAIIDAEKSDAPYRGAIGYKPKIDSKTEMFKKSVLPYSSPFELMAEIINEQLNADVIGCVIEDTSLFKGSTVLGGGIVIKRRGKTKNVKLEGENIEFDDDNDDYGNDGVIKGEVMIVECDSDEAIGLGLACDVGIFVESSEWTRSKIDSLVQFQDNEDDGIMDALPALQNSLESFVIAREGGGIKSENTKIQAPKGSNRDIPTGMIPASNENRPVFNTDIPVQSISEFDSLSVQDKAQLLLSMESFDGDLPRPRSLRNVGISNLRNEEPRELDILDEKLLPLIDESVRRQILVREAVARGDTDEASELQKFRSRRQLAKEKSDIAESEGKKDLAKMWNEEADFYATLRADVTQDEGRYSEYLDRDEWYERTRRKISEKNKNRFRHLLDGLE